jgi:threonine/homoserine/homoserine lactone efflux protein
LLASSDRALVVVEITGACYLLGAGISQIRHRNNLAEGTEALAMPLRRGFLTSVLNPKGTMFFLAFLPRFLPASSTGWAAFGLGVVFAALTIVVYGGYAVAANQARSFLDGPGAPVVLRTVAGCVFIGFAMMIAIDHA